jgi:hypothetical protein
MAARANHGVGFGRATRPGWKRLLHRLDVAGSGLIQVHSPRATTITTRRSLSLSPSPTRTTRTRTSTITIAMAASISTPAPLKSPASPSSASASAVPHPPLHRPASPYSDPRQLGPRSQILATRTSNFHSTSLRNSQSSCSDSSLSPTIFQTSKTLTPLHSGDHRPQRQPHKSAPGRCRAPAGTHRAGERAAREGTH